MHSGDIATKFVRPVASISLFPRVPPLISEKILDLRITLCHWYIMHKEIIHVVRHDISFRVTIPRKHILLKNWGNVEYVLLEESGPDTIVLRRFVDAKALETDS